MFSKLLNRLRGNNPSEKLRPLPKGFKAVPPIKDKRLRELVMGPDITTSGGTNTISDGHPLLNRQHVHR